ncbi:hypothetical protein EYF80_056080 [Liparis tanakae]|uniref:Uncharacterized protein n=1 Tax=Liparis tanakae TaxID=230148 RepID=A0A4Z2EZ04_9TELE|nr:hypothetical protein EYF80_056080 [Liparis tanakae]
MWGKDILLESGRENEEGEGSSEFLGQRSVAVSPRFPVNVRFQLVNWTQSLHTEDQMQTERKSDQLQIVI